MNTIFHGCPNADGQTCSILYNDCYGGFTYSHEALDEYRRRKNEPTDPKIEPATNDPIMLELFREWGSAKMSGNYSRINMATFPVQYSAYLQYDEYDGKESFSIDYQRYVLDEIKRIAFSSEDDAIDKIRALFTNYHEELKTDMEKLEERIQKMNEK